LVNRSILIGVARGCGWQKLGAFVNLGAYYLVGIPFSVVLAFVFHMKGQVRLNHVLIMFLCCLVVVN